LKGYSSTLHDDLDTDNFDSNYGSVEGMLSLSEEVWRLLLLLLLLLAEMKVEQGICRPPPSDGSCPASCCSELM
jgi:hypothetical protein